MESKLMLMDRFLEISDSINKIEEVLKEKKIDDKEIFSELESIRSKI